jgi:hypothetical protein
MQARAQPDGWIVQGISDEMCFSAHSNHLQAQVTGSTLSQMGQMKKDAKEQHEKLVALLEKDSTLTGSDRSSVSSKV